MTRTIEQIKETLDTKVNWNEVHMAYLFPIHGYNTSILFFDNGHISQMANNTFFVDEPEDLIGSILTPGLANLDSEEYAEGWCKWDNEKNAYVVDEDGRHLDTEEMCRECVKDGDWEHRYDDWKEKILQEAEYA